ncbi:MAG: ABC transporter permease subunit [[Eubacterium] sulci]|nr:nickel transporter permease NikC [Eubacterium sulci ATCC 35585]MBF1179347.1 ABC transporter permease subunit [[Eubacterium] sulci]EUC77684.1 ABC transporter, permease protein [Eubacterium sulci ATCC 35585]MBF1180208.1 ABC transporter permease subunit [[Eubacterium] sulci]MBF1183296.1 ABC transporter permease subunit [[Eubacterium] sulci]
MFRRKKKAETLLEQNGNLSLNRIMRQRKTQIGLAIAILFILVAIFAPLIAPNNPTLVDVTVKLQNPSLKYPFGTDQLGRCVFSRIVCGSRYSLFYSFTVLAITLIVGLPVGMIAGYVGGKWDTAIMRVIDIFLAMPSFIIVLAIAGSFGTSGRNLILAMSMSYWANYARVSRALTLKIKGESYFQALKAGGLSNVRIIFKHVLRNIMPSIIALATVEIGSIILSIAGYSFIGLGVQAPNPEWGIMLSESKPFIQTFPQLMMYPGLTIMLIVFGVNMLGEGVQDGLSEK